MRLLRHLMDRLERHSPPTRLEFIEAIPIELEKLCDVRAGTQFVYQHPLSGIPEVVIVLPTEEIVIVEFHELVLPWPLKTNRSVFGASE